MDFVENISGEEIESLAVADFSGPIVVVSEPGEYFAEAIEYLQHQTVLGFDTETKPNFKSGVPHNEVAILQLSGYDKAYIFRLIDLKMPPALSKILSSESIIKVGAAIHDDIKGLRRYKEFTARGFVDLQKIGEDFGIKEKSVRKMAAIILDKKVSKSQQLSNWEAPNLSGAQLKYAAIDAWICREMYVKLCDIDSTKCVPVKISTPKKNIDNKKRPYKKKK